MKEIQLTQGKVALVDDADYEFASSFKWAARIHKEPNSVKWYAVRNRHLADGPTAPKSIYLHRVLMNAPRGVVVDHRDGDGLNCVRSNMRLATVANNSHNMEKTHGASRFKGVTWSKRRRSWEVKIKIGGKQPYVRGRFESEEDAARAYDALARKHFGEFARCNFPEVA